VIGYLEWYTFELSIHLPLKSSVPKAKDIFITFQSLVKNNFAVTCFTIDMVHVEN